MDVDCIRIPIIFIFNAVKRLIGLALGVAMVVSIIWACKGQSCNRRDVLAATFRCAFGLFFPVQSTADFFGQWNNTFVSAIAFALVVA